MRPPLNLYVGRRPRRRGLGCLYLILTSMLLAVLGGVVGVAFAFRLVALPSSVGPLQIVPPTVTPAPTPAPVPIVAGRVSDAYSGSPLAGVAVWLGDQQAVTNGDGAFRFIAPPEAGALRVEAPAYELATRPVAGGQSATLALALRPTRLSGVVRGSGGQPVTGARVTVGALSIVTGDDGRYEVGDVPADAVLTVEARDHARYREPVGRRVNVDVTLRQNTLAGVVRSRAGQPIARATVAFGRQMTTTGADGRFRFADVAEPGQLAVKAGNYAVERRQVQPGSAVEVVLAPLVVKGLYMTHLTVADERRFTDLLALVKRTELNAVVIDVKGDSGYVFYESKVPLARDIGAVEPAYDIRRRLRQLREANIYAIARVVVMEDTMLAKARPQWAVRNKMTGQPWRDFNGIGWMNAYRSEVWDYNVAIAREVAELGFDEVQLDYVRFPSDGLLDQADFGQQHTEEARTEAIAAFLGRAFKELASLGVFLSADLFGLTTVAEDDMGIGQRIDQAADVVDYICPMVYPSHYARGSFGFANPAAKPYEVVNNSLKGGRAKLGEGRALLRPWLQDFDLFGTPYTPEMVRAQIKASEENQTAGWMIWNAGNKYQEAALRPRS